MWVRRRKNERYHPDCINSTLKHGGGKLQVWGCMAANGVGTLKVVKVRLNAASYVQLICRTLKQDGERLGGNNFLFQQDGAPCHTAGSTKAWFERKNNGSYSIIPWSSQSPGLNPIEHTWEEMKAKLKNKPCKSIDELESAISQSNFFEIAGFFRAGHIWENIAWQPVQFQVKLIKFQGNSLNS